MHSIAFYEFIEYVMGFTNAMLGIVMAIYVTKTLRKHRKGENRKVISIVKTSLLAIVFLSGYSLSHFTREIFELKDKYGPIVEVPEYVFIFLVFLILLGQIMFFDAPDDAFR